MSGINDKTPTKALYRTSKVKTLAQPLWTTSLPFDPPTTTNTLLQKTKKEQDSKPLLNRL